MHNGKVTYPHTGLMLAQCVNGAKSPNRGGKHWRPTYWSLIKVRSDEEPLECFQEVTQISFNRLPRYSVKTGFAKNRKRTIQGTTEEPPVPKRAPSVLT